MPHKKSPLTALLDEIERLRGVLCHEHSSACTILRSGTECTCGAAARTISMLSETHSLRAQLVRAQGLVACMQHEIVRMDVRVLELGGAGSAPLARGSSSYMVATMRDVASADSDAVA